MAEKDYVLYDVLKIESLVQIIEGMWYFTLYYFLNQIKTNTIASKRYTDWYITTPIMLLSTAIYMEYKHGKFLTTKEILKEYRYSFLRLFLFNFLMLYFGYQYEINQKTKNLYTGFLFFSCRFMNYGTHLPRKQSTVKTYSHSFLLFGFCMELLRCILQSKKTYFIIFWMLFPKTFMEYLFFTKFNKQN